MRKLIIFVVFTAFLAAGLPVFAQDKKKGNDSEYYYVNVSLEKIFPYRNGYVVQYRKGVNQMDRAYLPMTWFSSSAGKGEIITLPTGNTWPSLTVYYKNGEFSHVRLYVHHSESHPTWGVVSQTVNLDSRFEDVETVDIKFK